MTNYFVSSGFKSLIAKILAILYLITGALPTIAAEQHAKVPPFKTALSTPRPRQ